MNKQISLRERFEIEHPLIETVGEIEIRKDFEDDKVYYQITLKSHGLWTMHDLPSLDDARDLANKANELLSYGFSLYGFNAVDLWDYISLRSFAKNNPEKMEKYWCYL